MRSVAVPLNAAQLNVLRSALDFYEIEGIPAIIRCKSRLQKKLSQASAQVSGTKSKKRARR